MTNQLGLPTLLIISDNPAIRYWLKKQLESQYILIEATTQAKALEVALHSSLHFIILDAGFKSVDFLQLAHEIRQTPSNLLTPILLITDKLKKTFRTTALEAGVTDFLFQPLDADELETRIQTIKKSTDVRKKVLGLSARISGPQQEASPTFFKDKLFIDEKALQFLTDARKRNIALKMLVVRIDRFAEIRAKCGNDISQELLQNFTALLSQSFGKNSTVSPFTDGQFIVLFPSLGQPESQKMIDNLRKLVEQRRFSTKQGIPHLTASFAISDIDTTEKSFNSMINATMKSLEQSSNLSNQTFIIDKKNTL
jgi:PleD family two-component response regulator